MHTSSPHQETGRLVASTPLSGSYQLLRLHVPQLCHAVAPGQLLSVEGVTLPVMRCNRQQQWLELLSSSPLPWDREAMLQCKVMGVPFALPTTAVTALLIAEDLGLAPITFLADTLRKERDHSLLVLLGFGDEMPFRPAPSRIMVNALPAGVIATMPLFEDWHLPCRIAHGDEPPGCYGDDVTELARHWLQRQGGVTTALFFSGGFGMGEAVASLATEFGLNHQAIVIEY